MSDTPWPHFWRRELACRCGECGRGWQDMDNDFMLMLEALRERFGGPLHITSAMRCPAYNAMVSTTGVSGPHTTGMAVDIGIAGEPAYRLLEAAIAMGFRGIGLRQRGPAHTRFIHLDDLGPEDGFPRPRVWTY